MTRIDDAHAAMLAAPDPDAARLIFYGVLADSELILLLMSEAEGDTLSPRIFDLSGGPVALAFDSEDRLAAFTGGVSPYAALPGRIIAAGLAGQGIGLGLNLGAPSEMLLPPEAMDWLSRTLAHGPDRVEALPERFDAPKNLPDRLLAALDARLARAAGLANAALLAAVTYRDGRRGHLLAFLDAAPGAEPALARAASEALMFSGVEAGEMDVVFLGSAHPAAISMARAALRFDLPVPAAPEARAPAPPGMDPTRPPVLR
jgi:SseB protein N-terminal domain